jgi:predicted secreted Zn-dependent protease
LALQEREYEVRGRTAGELLASLRAAGPRQGGRRYFGLHQWHLTWQFRWEREGPWCTVHRVTVTLRAETLLPRWAAPPDAESDLRRAWDRFLSALRSHEAGHRDLATSAARAVRQAVLADGPVSCGVVADRANATARAVVGDYNRRNAVYDDDTRHGATQGAVWPPASAPRSAGGAGVAPPL